MSKLFSNGTISELWTLSNRTALLGDFFGKKVVAPDANFEQLTRVISMGTGRILKSMREHVGLLEQRWDVTDPSHKRVIGLLHEAIAEIADTHEGLQSGESVWYVEWYAELNNRIRILFARIEQEKITFEQKMSASKTPTDTVLSQKMSLFFEKVRKFCGGVLVSMARLAGVATLATALLTVNTNEAVSSVKQIVPSQVETIVRSESSQVNVIEESSVETRAVFQNLSDNPQNIALIPKFEERTQSLAARLATDPLFQSNSYIKGKTWVSWNMEAAKTLFPTVRNITDEEARIVAQSLQSYLKVPGADGMLGLSSKKMLLERFYYKTTSKSSPDLSKTSWIQALLGNIMNQWIGMIKRIIAPKEFERVLMAHAGTPHISADKKHGKDCVRSIGISMKDSQVTDSVFQGNSRSMMQYFTLDRRSIMEAQEGDFIFWKSVKYEGSYHIAYVAERTEKGLWIIDNSIDVWFLTKRFLSWERISKKEWVVGAANFLARDNSDRNSPV